MSGGANRTAKPGGSRGRRKAPANLSNIPEFMKRTLGILAPADADQPVNRAQRRALAKRAGGEA